MLLDDAVALRSRGLGTVVGEIREHIVVIASLIRSTPGHHRHPATRGASTPNDADHDHPRG